MRQYLAEGIKGAFPFIVDRTKAIVAESGPPGTKNIWRIPGRFSECDKVNGNGRRYRRNVWEKNLQPGSTLQKLIEMNAAFGLLEHPADGQVSLKSPISHAVTAAKLNEDGTVTGEITVIDMGETSDGHKLKCLIEFGYNPLVSSRGFGSLVKASDGIDEVQDDYVCEGWDIVIKPSFENAQLQPDRSALDTVLARPAAAAESLKETASLYSEMQSVGVPDRNARYQMGEQDPVDVQWNEFVPKLQQFFDTDPTVRQNAASIGVTPQELFQQRMAELKEQFRKVVAQKQSAAAAPPTAAAPASNSPPATESKPNLEQSAPSAAAPIAAAPAQNKNTITESMTNITEVKTRIQTYKAQRPNDARAFAEGVAQMAELHQQVANYVAEDAKRNYEGMKLHQEIEAIEKAWAENQAAPAKTAAKLREDRNKVLHVCKNLVETALKYKSALSEQLKSAASVQAVVEELTTNGTGWMELANKRKDQRDFIAKKYQVACEALMLMSNRYKEDMTIVGRHALNLEFKEALAAKPDLQKSLNEAKTPQDILAIREQLEGKKPGASATPNPATPAASKPATESKTAPAAAAPLTESKPQAAAPIVVESETARNPRSISESMEMVRRLSLASAK